MSENRLKVLSLFTGAGGFDIGFHEAGFEANAYVEIDKRFCETLKYNPNYFIKERIINSDIRMVGCEEIHGKVDFIIGGPPCQSFSASGKRLGLDDDRGTLFKHYVRFLKHFQPNGFLFENVRGLLYANQGNAIKEICSEFEKAGYGIRTRLLNAADYGVPQFRERVFILGWLKSKIPNGLHFPSPSHGPDSVNKKPYVTVWEAIKDIYDENEEEKPFGGKYGHLLPLVPEGNNYHYFSERMGYPEPIFGWRTKFSNFLYKVDRNQPARTIQAQPGKYSGPFHWKNRKMNTQELIRLQTFPKDFIFPGGSSVALHQIGNSVPPVLAHSLAKVIYKQLLNLPLEKNDLIYDYFRFSFDKRKGIIARETRQQGISRRSQQIQGSLF